MSDGRSGWLAHAVRRRASGARPRLGQVIRPREEDSWREYPADGLTPPRLAQVLRAADEGAIDSAMALFEQMEEKDAHLHSVAQTRRLGLTGLEWQVLSAAEVHSGVDPAAAAEAADYCRGRLTALQGFEPALRHLSLAIGRNIAAAEILWDLVDGEHEVVDLVPVGFDRLAVDRLGRVRIRTGSHASEGILPPPNKFIVHTPHAMSGHPMRGGLLRVSSLAYLAKHLAMKDWMVFAELFGMPIRIARYDPSATPEEKRELLRMLRELGSAAAGVFSKSVDLEIRESSKGPLGGPPYPVICSFFNRELSKAWQGQTLTSDTADMTGTYAAAEVHDRVRADIREDDIRNEGRTLRRDLLGPMVRVQFGEGVPVPYFRRRFHRTGDPEALARVLATAVRDLGVRVPARWSHEVLGIPQAGADEEVLQGRAAGV